MQYIEADKASWEEERNSWQQERAKLIEDRDVVATERDRLAKEVGGLHTKLDYRQTELHQLKQKQESELKSYKYKTKLLYKINYRSFKRAVLELGVSSIGICSITRLSDGVLKWPIAFQCKCSYFGGKTMYYKWVKLSKLGLFVELAIRTQQLP